MLKEIDMLKITDTNYDEYKKVYQIIEEFVWGKSNFESLMIITPAGLQKPSKSILKRAVKAGLNDLLTYIKLELPEKDKKLLNEKLVNEKLPGLWNLISIINEVPVKVLKRGKIRNLDEWYVIKEILDDVDSDISEKDRAQLGELFAEFEMRQSKKK